MKVASDKNDTVRQ